MAAARRRRRRAKALKSSPPPPPSTLPRAPPPAPSPHAARPSDGRAPPPRPPQLPPRWRPPARPAAESSSQGGASLQEPLRRCLEARSAGTPCAARPRLQSRAATADSGKKRPVLLAPLGTALGRRLCRAWRGDRAKQRTPPPARPRADLPSPGVDRRTEAATKPRSNAAARRAPRIAAALPARPARPSCARPRLPCSLGRRRVARVPPARSCCGGRGIRCPRRTPIHATPPLPTKGATPGYEVVAGGQRRRAALHPAPPLEEGRGGSSRRRTPTSQPMMHARPVGACGALCRPRLQATASDQAARRRAVPPDKPDCAGSTRRSRPGAPRAPPDAPGAAAPLC